MSSISVVIGSIKLYLKYLVLKYLKVSSTVWSFSSSVFRDREMDWMVLLIWWTITNSSI